MRYSKKSQYTEKDDRIIYVLFSPLTKEFFVSHCRKNLLKDIFRQHCYGKRYQTKDCVESLKTQHLHPCLFTLEEINATKVEAFNYVIAWTKIFLEAGYTSLNRGNILDYIHDLYENNLLIYNTNKVKDLTALCNCKVCLVSQYGRKRCPLFKGETNGITRE